MSKRKSILLYCSLALWAIVAVTGSVALLAYSEKPGAAAPAPSDWPADSKLAYSPGHPALVMAIHPKCGCSRASLAELARATVNADADAQIFIVLIRPAGVTDDWSQTATVDAAREIPNVKVFEDNAGVEAARFGAETSGHTVLYDRHGHRVFSGGLTAARGHEGATPAAAIIANTLSSRDSSLTSPSVSAPVYGCGLGIHPSAEARQ